MSFTMTKYKTASCDIYKWLLETEAEGFELGDCDTTAEAFTRVVY